MKICHKCNLPMDICLALAYYRAAVKAIQNAEAPQAVYFMNSAADCERAYYTDNNLPIPPTMRINHSETLQ